MATELMDFFQEEKKREESRQVNEVCWHDLVLIQKQIEHLDIFIYLQN